MLKHKSIQTNRFFIKMHLADPYSVSAPDASMNYFSSSFTDRFGFFYHNRYNPYLKSASDILSMRGAILVAEGGMGKTYVMNSFADRVPPNASKKIAIGEYCGNSAELSLELSNIPDDVHYIFVDGVDEAPTIIPMLLRKLTAIDRDRIRLFIALRNIRKLKAFQEILDLPVYSLLPLSQEDVLAIAKHENVDEKAFIEKVIQEGLSPICAKPQGCLALLNGYKEDGLTNTSGEELWKRSVLSLCAENDSLTRLISKDETNCITPEECFNHAAKIALILKLTGRSVVSGMQETIPTDGKKCVPLSNFYEASDSAKINLILLRGIFMPVEDACFKFAHYSYFDYLAAVGLLNNVNRKHWRTILLSPDGTSMYPIWEGAASWLAVYDSEWHKIVLEIQPELLLVSDYTIDLIGADKLCDAIIRRADNMPREQRYDAFFIKRLAKLKNREIIPILDAALSKSCPPEQAEMAIDIIRECQIHELENRLIDIFCDPTFEHELRKHAGYALCEYALDESRARCKDILRDSKCAPDLKGLLFRMTWPRLITMSEMGPHLTEPSLCVIDAYYFWMVHDFPNTLLGLTPEKAKEALEWAVVSVHETDGYRNSLLNMRKQIFTLCWIKFATYDFMPLLAEGMRAFLKIHMLPFADESIHGTPPALCYTNKEFYADIEKRHRLAEALIGMSTLSVEEVALFSARTLFDTDIDFVFSMIESNTESTLCEKWCNCLCALQRYVALPEMTQRWNDVHRRFPDIIICDAATMMYERKKWADECEKEIAHLNHLAQERETKNNKQRSDNVHFIKSVLESHDAYKYFPWRIDFFIKETDLDTIDYRKSDIWKEFSPAEIKQLALIAKDFLSKERGSSFPRDNNSVHPVIPRAFFLVNSEIDDGLGSLPQNAWQEFSTLLFDFIDFDDKGVLRPIFEGMSKIVPHIFNAAMLNKIKNRVANGDIPITIKYGDLLDDEACLEIVRFAVSNGCDDLQRYWLLRSIYELMPHVVKDFMSQNALFANSDIACLGNCTSVLVLVIFPNMIHDFIQRLVTAPIEWGKRWVEDAMRVGRNGLASLLALTAIDDLTTFYIWLHSNYAATDAPIHHEVYCPTIIDDIYSFINSVLNAIKTHPSSAETLSGLRRIYEAFPMDDWLNAIILDVKKAKLRKNTPTYSTDEIKHIIDGNDSGVIINSPEDLFHLVLELLEKYQIYLTGKESPRVDDLWDYNGKNVAQHKEEGHFSNHLKSFLEERLYRENIAINREVKLNAGIDGEAGSQTDIWINAFSRCSGEKITLCIEVKGSWNNETLTAMDNQLIGKYMGAGGADAGIFLVGWFRSKTSNQKNICNNDKNAAEAILKQQEALATAAGHLVRSVVIDCPAKH